MARGQGAMGGGNRGRGKSTRGRRREGRISSTVEKQHSIRATL